MSTLFGSVLPGLVLCAVVAGTVVDPARTGLGAAALAVVLASVVGLLVHEAVRPWVPNAWAPGAIEPAVRVLFADKVRARFAVDATGEPALSLARTALATAGRGRDTEQLQAMQALCRGLVGAFLLGAAWSAGASTGTAPPWVAVPGLLLVAFAIGRQSGAFDRMFDGGALLVFPAAAVAVAVAARMVAPVATWSAAAAAVAGAVALVGLGWVAARAHDRYAQQLADEVIRGFVVLPD